MRTMRSIFYFLKLVYNVWIWKVSRVGQICVYIFQDNIKVCSVDVRKYETEPTEH